MKLKTTVLKGIMNYMVEKVTVLELEQKLETCMEEILKELSTRHTKKLDILERLEPKEREVFEKQAIESKEKIDKYIKNALKMQSELIELKSGIKVSGNDGVTSLIAAEAVDYSRRTHMLINKMEHRCLKFLFENTKPHDETLKETTQFEKLKKLICIENEETEKLYRDIERLIKAGNIDFDEKDKWEGLKRQYFLESELLGNAIKKAKNMPDNEEYSIQETDQSFSYFEAYTRIIGLKKCLGELLECEQEDFSAIDIERFFEDCEMLDRLTASLVSSLASEKIETSLGEIPLILAMEYFSLIGKRATNDIKHGMKWIMKSPWEALWDEKIIPYFSDPMKTLIGNITSNITNELSQTYVNPICFFDVEILNNNSSCDESGIDPLVKLNRILRKSKLDAEAICDPLNIMDIRDKFDEYCYELSLELFEKIYNALTKIKVYI